MPSALWQTHDYWLNRFGTRNMIGWSARAATDSKFFLPVVEIGFIYIYFERPGPGSHCLHLQKEAPFLLWTSCERSMLSLRAHYRLNFPPNPGNLLIFPREAGILNFLQKPCVLKLSKLSGMSSLILAYRTQCISSKKWALNMHAMGTHWNSIGYFSVNGTWMSKCLVISRCSVFFIAELSHSHKFGTKSVVNNTENKYLKQKFPKAVERWPQDNILFLQYWSTWGENRVMKLSAIGESRDRRW